VVSSILPSELPLWVHRLAPHTLPAQKNDRVITSHGNHVLWVLFFLLGFFSRLQICAEMMEMAFGFLFKMTNLCRERWWRWVLGFFSSWQICAERDDGDGFWVSLQDDKSVQR
jgi:hypothetical protein